jgi:hypothetical protein
MHLFCIPQVTKSLVPASFSLVRLPSASTQMLSRICNPCFVVQLGSFGGALEP